MRFLRALRGGSGGAGEPEDASAEGQAGADEGGGTLDDAAREHEIAREFDETLTDLARRQVRLARYAWAPPSQTDRRGRWQVTARTTAVAGGRELKLDAGTQLELAEAGDEVPERTTWRFRRIKDGREVELAAGPGGAWPGGLVRPRRGEGERG